MVECDASQRAAAGVDTILELCGRRGRVLILTQDNPDPDALASAAALRDLLFQRLRKRAAIGYGGEHLRAENNAMMRLLRIDARHLTPAQLRGYATVCMVDTQPLAGNNILGAGGHADIVIDHHSLPAPRKWTAQYADVRPWYGATTTILYEYLAAAGVPISTNLATAMFYGIQSDTQDLGREATPADIVAYRDLFLPADKKKLARVRNAPVPPEYFQMLAASLADCVVAGHAVVSCIRICRNVEMIAEVADLLLRLEGMRTAVCYGVHGNRIYLSVRTRTPRGNAAQRLRRVVYRIGAAGGHRMMAGGQVPLEGDPEKRVALVRARILGVFAPRRQPVPLTSPRWPEPLPRRGGARGFRRRAATDTAPRMHSRMLTISGEGDLSRKPKKGVRR